MAPKIMGRSEGDVAGHIAGAVTHWHAPQGGAREVHACGRGGERALIDGAVREEPVVLFTHSDDRVSEREGQLWKCEETIECVAG